MAAAGDTGADKDIAVEVRQNGETIVVEVAFSVPASLPIAWAVLTDFDHMSEFVSNLQSSRVVSRHGNRLQVAQQGKATRGMLSFAFESVREIDLLAPHTIRSRMVSGNMKKLDGITQLATDGSGTRITYHGESLPTVWVPPVIGLTFIENEVREQYAELRNEILKRQAAGR